MKTPYDHQEEAISAAFDYLGRETGHPLIAMPTGSGKALVIAEICKRALSWYPGIRITMGTHTKELVDQNAAELLEQWPTAPLGIYSAGLGRKEFAQPIVFGTIGSIRDKSSLLGPRNLFLVDEAHLVNDDEGSGYRKFITEQLKLNPNMRVVGLSATIFRLRMGLLTNGGVFNDVCYNLANMEGINRLIDGGYLAPIIAKRTHTTVDPSSIKLVAGEFHQGQMQAAWDQSKVTLDALGELVPLGYNRRSWVLFGAGVEHAEHIAEYLRTYFGIPAAAVHSKMPEGRRDEIIKDHKSGKLRAVVSNGVLTTGYNHRPVDLIGMLRHTMSAGLNIQMWGRGMRTAEGKIDCLGLDFARNTERLGPINDPVIPTQRGKGPPGDPPIRICDVCGTYNHASVRKCVGCGHEFEIITKLKNTASTAEFLRREPAVPDIQLFDVQRCIVLAHTAKSGNGCVKVCYYAGGHTFYEYVSVEGRAKKMGRDWYRTRATERNITPPDTNAELIEMAPDLRVPQRVRVNMNSPHKEIVGYVF